MKHGGIIIMTGVSHSLSKDAEEMETTSKPKTIVNTLVSVGNNMA